MKKIIPILALVLVTMAFAGWTQLPDVMTTTKAVKDGAVLVTHGTNLYAFKGGNTVDFIAYDPAAATWSAKPVIPFALKPNGKPYKKAVKQGGSLVVAGDYIYAFKGGNTKEFWMYDITEDTWIRKADVTGEKGIKSGGCLAMLNDKIYAFKGGNTNDFIMYDPLTNAWTSKALLTGNTKAVKGGGSLVSYDGLIYAFVGHNTYDFFVYDDVTNTWTKKADAIFGFDPTKKIKDGADLTVLDSKIYAFKGGNKQSFGIYDPALNTWASGDTIPLGTNNCKVKHGGSLVTYDGAIYAFKGGNKNDFWKFILPTP